MLFGKCLADSFFTVGLLCSTQHFHISFCLTNMQFASQTLSSVHDA